MIRFYKQAASLMLACGLISLLLLWWGYSQAHLQRTLLPLEQKDIPWQTSIEPPAPVGATSLTIKKETTVAEYEFTLAADRPFPYTSYGFNFAAQDRGFKPVDLSRFDAVQFKIKCDPQNILLFVLFTHDELITRPGNSDTYRVASTFFSCEPSWKTTVIRLDELRTPDWWLDKYELELTDRDFNLQKSYEFRLVNSLQSPRELLSHVMITDVLLVGQNRLYPKIAWGLVGLLWVLFVGWFLKRYVAVRIDDVTAKLKNDKQLIAYKELTIAPQKDKERSSVLRYMATEYANPELSLELATKALGMNRNKINDALRGELGLTFSAYLNKLRLTEAARLLADNPQSNVAEIALAVGYNNASYFNRLFKTEYGCTPRSFQSLSSKQNS